MNTINISIDEAIELLSHSHPITKEYEAAFRCAIDSMKFVRDFLPLKATPERMEHALHLLNALEYIAKN
jgi:hypothetical protein